MVSTYEFPQEVTVSVVVGAFAPFVPLTSAIRLSFGAFHVRPLPCVVLSLQRVPVLLMCSALVWFIVRASKISCPPVRVGRGLAVCQVLDGKIPAVQMQKLSASDGWVREKPAPAPAAPVARLEAVKVGVTVT